MELAHADQLTKEKIEELNKTREEQIQKKQKILEELQKVERELQLKTQQQLKKQYLEVKATLSVTHTALFKNNSTIANALKLILRINSDLTSFLSHV